MSAGGSKLEETPDVELIADSAESPDMFRCPSTISPRSSTSAVGTSSNTGPEIEFLSIYDTHTSRQSLSSQAFRDNDCRQKVDHIHMQ